MNDTATVKRYRARVWAQVLARRLDTRSSIGEICDALQGYLNIAEKAAVRAELVTRALDV